MCGSVRRSLRRQEQTNFYRPWPLATRYTKRTLQTDADRKADQDTRSSQIPRSTTNISSTENPILLPLLDPNKAVSSNNNNNKMQRGRYVLVFARMENIDTIESEQSSRFGDRTPQSFQLSSIKSFVERIERKGVVWDWPKLILD